MKTRHTLDLGGLLSKKMRNLKRQAFRDMEIGEAIPEYPEDRDMTEPYESVETFLEKDSHKRKPSWE